MKTATRTSAHAGQGVPARFSSSRNGGTAPRFGAVHLFSPSALTNATGQVVEKYNYTAYGNQTISAPGGAGRSHSAVGFDRSFTGFTHDAESGLAYARNRMYSPSLGEYVSRNQYYQNVGVKYTALRSSPLNVYLRDITEVEVGDSYVDGYSSYVFRLGLDPSGEPITVTFVSGNTVVIDSGKGDIAKSSGRDDSLEFQKLLKDAKPGSIKNIEIYGHASTWQMKFSYNNDNPQDSIGYTSDPGSGGGDKFESTGTRPTFDFGDALDKALSQDGEVGLNGCNTCSGDGSIAQALSKKLGKGRKVRGFNGFRSGGFGPPVKGQTVECENGVKGKTTGEHWDGKGNFGVRW